MTGSPVTEGHIDRCGYERTGLHTVAMSCQKEWYHEVLPRLFMRRGLFYISYLFSLYLPTSNNKIVLD